MNLFLPLFLALTLVFSSCSNETSHEGTTTKVELNDGQKWEANPETTDGIKKMMSLVGHFEPSENVADYQKLSEALNMNFKEIFAKCTMTGPGHDQLHNYLLPMLGLMKKMRSDDLELCKESVEKMDLRLKEYTEYFE